MKGCEVCAKICLRWALWTFSFCCFYFRILFLHLYLQQTTYTGKTVLLDAVWWSRGCALNEITFKEKRWMMDDKCRLNYKRTGYLSDVLPQIVSRAWLNWFSHHPAAIDALCEQENKCVSSFVLCGFHLHMLLDLWLLLHRSGNSFSAQCRGCFIEWCFKFSFVREMAPVWQGAGNKCLYTIRVWPQVTGDDYDCMHKSC